MPGTHYTAPTPASPRIVVGYDGSHEARAAVEDAARRAGSGGTVYVVVCFDAPPSMLGGPELQRALTAAQRPGRELFDDLDDGGIPALLLTHWEPEFLAGPPGEAIVHVAEARNADEIAIGSRGRGRAHALLGSVSHDVLHRADRPVRVITSRAASRMSRPPATAS